MEHKDGAGLEGVLRKSSACLRVGRGVLTAPWEVAETRTFQTSLDARGVVSTPRRRFV